MAAPRLPFFVYGTLMKGFRNYDKHVRGFSSLRFLHDRAYVEGAALYHFAYGYPGLYASSSADCVYGELLTADDPIEYDQLLADLDALEEYFGPNDPSNEYDRVRVQVHPTDGGPIDAWVYYCKIPLEKAKERVASGDWRAYMTSMP
ncbi:hypothetical protein SPRG_04144 [Saprolegnia parasitica CBS 223.65]|uniref:Gamma-glutamylcyclotransferase AIG2-like domain-containing protein n=1 Tax=Saprolegnia parasitica (strain CBS 223.65) TaxID=695850 RepID=A0A067CWN7_SAPPC|nr:hypothetical protein SPRG_04144 [Saprolegnia parasitica CBS 223.65]KDO30956.1 hypothetical protein SPRG_04144 [Saprolegnia parasitica CBS 223.65]|eukprot:XP_012198140.1 hypothetical protein SPRG_04144 [Saprolegnia parasitica CBS 223.65]